MASRLASGICPRLLSSVPSTSIPMSRIKMNSIARVRPAGSMMLHFMYHKKGMKLDQFPRVNAGYVLELYERLRLRARVRPRGARLAAACRGVRALPPAHGIDRWRRAARPAHAGRGIRAIPASDVSRKDAFLARRARHARARPRRDHLRRF